MQALCPTQVNATVDDTSMGSTSSDYGEDVGPAGNTRYVDAATRRLVYLKVYCKTHNLYEGELDFGTRKRA